MTLIYRERGTSGTQIDAVAGSLCIATLYKSSAPVKAPDGARWRWTFLLTAGPPGFAHQGEAHSLAEAKECVAESWLVWVAAAGLGASGRETL
jgi:hypothetical protein